MSSYLFQQVGGTVMRVRTLSRAQPDADRVGGADASMHRKQDGRVVTLRRFRIGSGFAKFDSLSKVGGGVHALDADGPDLASHGDTRLVLDESPQPESAATSPARCDQPHDPAMASGSRALQVGHRNGRVLR